MKATVVILWSLLAITGSADNSEPAIGSTASSAAFAKLKSLAGQWEGTGPMGKTQLSYELVAGGTTVLERESGEKMPVMLTLYHLDGSRLLLTHYCMTGNQPRMQATAFDPDRGELRFRFLDATNLTDPKAGHMRNAVLRFIDNDHLASEWDFFQDGAKKTTESMRYTRVR